MIEINASFFVGLILGGLLLFFCWMMLTMYLEYRWDLKEKKKMEDTIRKNQESS